MEFYEEAVLVIIGLLGGWFLSQIGSVLSALEEKKRRLNRALSIIFIEYRNLQSLIALTEMAKDNAGDWEEFERLRQHISQKYFSKGESIRNRHSDVVDAFMDYRPLDLSIANKFLNNIEDISTTRIDKAAGADTDAYVRLLSILEVSIDAAAIVGRRLIRSTAMQVGPLTFMRSLFEISSIHAPRSTSQKNISFLKKHFGETYSMIRARRGGRDEATSTTR